MRVQEQLQNRLMEVSEVEDEVASLHGQLEAQLLQKLDEQVLCPAELIDAVF